ncbi:MAG: ketoacyl-ACP synthase III [Paludibacteraceae bacterium]|nr:ketoacyl-ACP synthase III [Paludibacteraceae bacterium]
MKAYIKAISYYLPSRILTNQGIEKEFPEWSAEKVTTKVGIEQRYIASSEETAGDMAYYAAEKLFAEHNIDRAYVDFVLLCTQSPDYFLPSTACVLQNRLHISKSSGALDFNLGCSGYVYGLSLAKGLIVGGIAKNVLLITSETYTKYIHPKDKGNRTIFGDGASASLISTEGFAEIGEFVVGTDGSGAEYLIVKSGASRHPQQYDDLQYDESGNPISGNHLYMNGPEIFSFTILTVPKMIKEVLEKNDLSKDQVSLYVLHQANTYILEFLRKKMKIDEDRFYLNLQRVGNTVSSTIPIALCDAQQEGKLKGNIVLAGFGVGLSWSATVIKC